MTAIKSGDEQTPPVRRTKA